MYPAIEPNISNEIVLYVTANKPSENVERKRERVITANNMFNLFKNFMFFFIFLLSFLFLKKYLVSTKNPNIYKSQETTPTSIEKFAMISMRFS